MAGDHVKRSGDISAGAVSGARDVIRVRRWHNLKRLQMGVERKR